MQKQIILQLFHKINPFLKNFSVFSIIFPGASPAEACQVEKSTKYAPDFRQGNPLTKLHNLSHQVEWTYVNHSCIFPPCGKLWTVVENPCGQLCGECGKLMFFNSYSALPPPGRGCGDPCIPGRIILSRSPGITGYGNRPQLPFPAKNLRECSVLSAFSPSAPRPKHPRGRKICE